MIANLLSRAFRRNQRVIHAQADGVINEDSLAQTQYNVNCLNWVLGHIVSSRSDILENLGADRVVDDQQMAKYLRESEPITGDGPGVIPFDELLGLLDASETALEGVLAEVDDGFLAEETDVGEGRMASRAAQVMFGLFHDTYHTGQTELLRQMSGKNDKVI